MPEFLTVVLVNEDNPNEKTLLLGLTHEAVESLQHRSYPMGLDMLGHPELTLTLAVGTEESLHAALQAHVPELPDLEDIPTVSSTAEVRPRWLRRARQKRR